MNTIINKDATNRRLYWIDEIRKLSGDFGDDSDRLQNELKEEISKKGSQVIIDHLRLCGDIPESYNHDSSEEKLYSKYTDSLLAATFNFMGIKSLVLKERADAADVESVAKLYSFVSDAKAFRLSRTAKNQKDFKVQAMDGWKRGKPFAMVVCPIYQLPTRSSQIYEQASARNVCIFTYSHLAMLISYSEIENKYKSEELLYEVFKAVQALNPSKDANSYWFSINHTMLNYSNHLANLWKEEKQAAIEAIKIAKSEALTFLAREREKIMRLSHEEALKELIRINNIENKINVITSVTDNGLLDIK